MDDQLLAAVRNRVEACVNDGDPSPAIAEEALVEAQRLQESLKPGPDQRTFDVAYALAWLHWCRYNALPDGERDDELEAAFTWFVTVAHFDPVLVPEQLRPVLPTVILRRAQEADIPGALGIAIQLLEEAAKKPSDSHEQASVLSHLSVALRIRFERQGDMADIDRAIDSGRAATGVVSLDSPNRAGYLSNLSGALQARFQAVGDLDDLNEAVTAAQTAVEAATSFAVDELAGCLTNASGALQARFRHLGDPADLDKAVEAARRAVEIAGPAHAAQAIFNSNFSHTLTARYEESGNLADIDDAVSAARSAVDNVPAGHPARAGFLSNLRNALHLRFDRLENLNDLNEAVDVASAAVDALPPTHPERSRFLSNLAGVLRCRFERTGRITDADAAITVGREAVESTAPGHADRARRQAELGFALAARYHALGELADLETAVAAARAALDGAPHESKERVGHLSNLGMILHTRFERTGDAADLDEAIDVIRAATGVSVRDRAALLGNLGYSLRTRFRLTSDLRDLEQAIALGREAIEADTLDPADRASLLNDVGLALQDRFESSGHFEDLAAATTAVRSAVRSAAGPRERAMFLFNLGRLFRLEYERSGRPGSADEALAAWQEAVAVTGGSPWVRMTAAMSAGEFAASVDQWATASGRYMAAVNLVPLLTWHGVGRQSREQMLAGQSGLASAAAACALAVSKPALSVALMELSRGVLWSRLLEIRTGLTLLRERAPELAARLDAIRAELDRPTHWRIDVGDPRLRPGIDVADT